MPEPESVRKLSDVYGVSRGIPLTYVERASVDHRFLNSLTRDKHIVVFGGSKQGKTCLRKRCLDEEDYIVVQCFDTTDIPQLYEALLKEAGARVDVSERTSVGGAQKLSVEVSVSGKIPLVAEGAAAGTGETERSQSTEIERRYLEITPTDPNDIIRVLTAMGFTKYIVLEDFHYLSDEVQKRVAFDLKAFHEKSTLCFVIVGVWLESNRLILHNGDLAGRLVPVDADKWEEAELQRVIQEGEPLLNIDFSDDVLERMVQASQGNVGILQEAAYRLCESRGIFRTQEAQALFDHRSEVDEILREIADEQAGRYQIFLSQFVEGLYKTQLDMYRWIGHVLIRASPGDLKAGLRSNHIHREILKVHPEPDRLQPNNTLQALKNVGKVQHKNRVQPIILDYDANDNVLHVVDSGFILFVEATNNESLLEIIGGASD